MGMEVETDKCTQMVDRDRGGERGGDGDVHRAFAHLGIPLEMQMKKPGCAYNAGTALRARGRVR
jgi:hypothetical protein